MPIFAYLLRECKFVLQQLGLAFFVRSFGCALFIFGGRIMKKILSVLVVISLLSSLAACVRRGFPAVIPDEGLSPSESDETTQNSTQPSVPEDTRYTNQITKTTEAVKDGDIVFLESNAIKKNKTLTLHADISSLGTIILRHGEGAFGTGYLTIDAENVNYYRYVSQDKLIKSSPHGLTIGGESSIVATVDNEGTLSISITSNGAAFTDKVMWYGSRGNIEMESVCTEMKDLVLTWECADYEKDIWFIGDSYLEFGSERWPHYLLENKDNFLLSGYGGAGAKAMYQDFQTALTHGKPKFAVWCIGMNNGDSEDEINQSWKTYTEKFLADCEANGITPILTTTPNTPTVNNIYKNEYVKTSGYRYIDFALAVGAMEKGSGWYEGMLSDDQLHPSAEGGKALADQVLIDLPEIK